MRVMVLALLLAGTALAAAPRARFSPEQSKQAGELSPLNRRAIALWGAGKREEALAARRRALAISRALLGDFHVTTASWLDGASYYLFQMGRGDEAARLLREE